MAEAGVAQAAPGRKWAVGSASDRVYISVLALEAAGSQVSPGM